MAERPMRVLVIDDASLVRLYYRRILEKAGYAIDEALNGVEAFEKLLENPPDAMIVDVNMPQMDGFTFLAKLREQASPACAIPALVTSTESKPQDMAAARGAGANYYLVKPVGEDVLIEHIALLCGRRA